MSYSSWPQIAKKYSYRFLANAPANYVDGDIYIYDNEKNVILGTVTMDSYGVINYDGINDLICDYLINIRNNKIESILK